MTIAKKVFMLEIFFSSNHENKSEIKLNMKSFNPDLFWMTFVTSRGAERVNGLEWTKTLPAVLFKII